MSNILIGTFVAQKLASKLMQFRIFASRHKSTSRPPTGSDSGSPLSGKKSSPTLPAATKSSCKLVPVSKKEECSAAPPLISTMNDMHVPCGWYGLRETLITSFYNRVLIAGLLVLVISFYLFKKDKLSRYVWDYQKYKHTFDYDTEYEDMGESADVPLEDIQNTTTAE